ncbi:hypothetical protein THF1C08_20242 [Vibrio jasicida]|uniref:Uncharacterized protein n=1 Tax=Vibrio jasicida TaxID=766224 RepID=A0AAU9QMQ3_9VIBR|nr:hypothetical protein THF1C08_20242 [Vibrio jasicida]CAH1586041.1 hypothetical protein THF1A12_20244 [Vibrio jasicida]
MLNLKLFNHSIRYLLVKILFFRVTHFTSINHSDDYSFVFSHSTANLLAALK